METVSGEGTSHRVNGIAVQAKIRNPPPLKPLNIMEKSTKRSVGSEPLILTTYNAGERACPPPIQSIDADKIAFIQHSKTKNLVWLLARLSNQNAQTICSWTGFNIMARGKVIVVHDGVGYLSTINAPATHMSTVNEILNQSMNIMQSLDLRTIVCVFDQALYAKAAEVVWKHREKF